MNIPTTAPINYSNSTIFYPDNTGQLGSFTRMPDSRTQVTLDYTTIMPTGLSLNKIGYVLSYGSAPQLIVSGSSIQGNGNILGFVVSGGVNGLKYILQINATLTDNITVFTHELEIVVSAPFVEDECGCPPMTMSRPLSLGMSGLPVPPVFQQANILNGDQTRFASTFIVFWVSPTAPTVANILDKWYNTTDGLIYDRATDGNSVFWVSTAQRPSQYTTAPTPPSNPQLGDMWYDTANNNLWMWLNSGAGPTWYPIAATTIPVTPGPNYTANSVPPSSPNTGDYWYNTGTNQLFMWMKTGATTLWYPLTPPTPTPNPTYTYSSKIQTFNTTGIYTPSSGMVTCVVECMGAGGGGGGALGDATLNTAGFMLGGGGGSSGGYSRSAFASAQVQGGILVTIGAGGTSGTASGAVNGGTGGNTSFGNLVIANGGNGGSTGNMALSVYGSEGGAPAIAGVGDLAVASNPGGNGGGIVSDPGYSGGGIWGGNGGAGFFGGAGTGGYSAVGATPTAGTGGAGKAGGGGGGAASGDNTQAVNGGVGGAGICVITEFCVN